MNSWCLLPKVRILGCGLLMAVGACADAPSHPEALADSRSWEELASGSEALGLQRSTIADPEGQTKNPIPLAATHEPYRYPLTIRSGTPPAGLKLWTEQPNGPNGTLLRVFLQTPEDELECPWTGNWAQTPVRFFRGGLLGAPWEAWIGIPYEATPGTQELLLTRAKSANGSEASQLRVPISISQGLYGAEVLKVDGRRVRPRAPQDVRRINAELALLKRIYQDISWEKRWSVPFQVPLDTLTVTSAFGTRRTYNGIFKNYHTGLDLRAPTGTPIYASNRGLVRLARDLFFTGNTVIVDHGFGVLTLYAHMSELEVKEGTLVNPRQLLGKSGQTGRVNGPHLHWQLMIHGIKVNPMGIVPDAVYTPLI